MIENVLVIDDEPLICDFLKETLERLNCQVEFCCNGKEAISIFTQGNSSFDLVFLDMKLPGASGIEVLKAIKELPLGKNAAIIGEVRAEMKQAGIKIKDDRWQEALDIDLLLVLLKKGERGKTWFQRLIYANRQENCTL